MNGRLYDPRLHRFLQPDNNLQEPYNTQNYNRYGYVLNNPLRYTDPTGESFWEIVAYVISTYILVANANGGELNPANWNANSILQAVTGIASSLASQGATNAFNKYIDNYGNHPEIAAGGDNPVESHSFVSIDNNVMSENEPPVSFFMRSNTDKDLQVFTNVFDQKNKKGNYNNGDSIFDVYGHGGFDGNGDGYFSDVKLFAQIGSGKEFDNRMSRVSLSYRKLINSGTDPKIINLYLCESARGGINSMAYKISKQHPNTLVVGFSNFVMYGTNKNGVPSINGISSNLKINLNDGYRVVYQNGEIISNILYSTYSIFNK